MVRFIILLTTIFFMANNANAVVTTTYFNERVALQGYITASGGSSLNGTYGMKITLKRAGGVTFWEKTFAAQQITNGVFSITISGNDDLGPTALTADLFDLASGGQSLQMDVVVDVDLDTVLEAGETFSAIPIVAVPTAMLADRCNMAINVIDDAIGTSKIEDGAVTMSKIDQASAASGEVLTWSGSAWVPTAIPTPATFSGSIAGDVSGTVGATSVDKIKGGTLTITGLAANEILVYDGSAWVNQKIDSASLFSGTMDLSSNLTGTTYAIDITGNAATATTATTAGSVSGAIDGTQLDAASVDLTTKVTGTLPVANGGTGAATLTGLLKGNGTGAFTAIADGTAGQFLKTDGAGALAFASAAGDVSGAITALSVDSIKGTSVSATTPTSGQALVYDGADWAPTTIPTPNNARFVLFEDFMGGPAAATVNNSVVLIRNFVAFSSNAAATISTLAPSGITNRPGILRLTPTATAAQVPGIAFCHLTNSTTLTNGSIVVGGGAIEFEASVRINNIGNASVFRIGLQNSITNTAPTKGAYFQYTGGGATPWSYNSKGTGTGTATVGANVTAGAWMKLKISINAAASSITFDVDGTSVTETGTAANLPISTDVLCPALLISGVNAANTMDIDYVSIKQDFTTPR